MSTFLIIVSTLISLISPIIYCQAILHGRVKPHRTARLVIFLICIIASVSLLAQHDQVAIYLALVGTLQTTIILLLSMKYGMGGWSKIDISCLIVALAGIVFWKTTNNPVAALFASLAADFIGEIPSFIKTWRMPGTEIWYFWGMDTIAGLLSMVAVWSLDLNRIAYPGYIFGVNFLMVLLTVWPRKNTLLRDSLH